MPEERIKEIADNADMIIKGYAFTKNGDNVSVLNINRPACALYMTVEGKILESSMDDIEQEIVLRIWEKDSEYMEVQDA